MIRLLFFAALLCGLIWIFYADSLDHTHRADQWLFLIDTMDYQSFGELIHYTYSYNRTRKMLPGDETLFRPVLNVVTTLELYFFGAYAPAPWQAASLILHCLVGVLLFAVLGRISRLSSMNSTSAEKTEGISSLLYPFAFAAFFAVNCSTQEQVIWAHLAGYVLFVVFFLTSLWCLLATLQAPAANYLAKAGGSIGCWLAAAAAAFTYELGVVFAILLAFFFPLLHPARSLRWKIVVGLVFLLIPVSFVITNWLDWVYHMRDTSQIEDYATYTKSFDLATTMQNLLDYLMFTIVQPFFPNIYYSAQERSKYQANSFSNLYAASNGFLGFIAGVIVLLFFWFASLRGVMTAWRRRAQDWPLLTFSLLGLLCLAANVGMIVLGRMNLRGHPGFLANNCYYPYITLLMLILTAYPLIALYLQQPQARQLRWISYVIPIAFVVLVIQQGLIVRRSNIAMAQYCAHYREVCAYLRNLTHDKSADYSFAIDYSRFPVRQPMGIPFPTICFRSSMNQRTPTDVVLMDNRSVRTVDFASLHTNGLPAPVFPDLLMVDRYYMFWELHGKVHGNIHPDDWINDYGTFDLERINRPYAIRDVTLAGALRQRDEKVAQWRTFGKGK